MQMLSVVKIGGNVIDYNEKLDAFLSAFAQLKGRKILVHGGGNTASKLAEQLNIPIQLHEGRRITSEAMLEVAVMTYAGLVNKQMITRLQAMGINAVGLSGADGQLIISQKRPVSNGIDWGRVGDPVQFNLEIMNLLFKANYIPVICPITMSEEGTLLNTNADTIASELAVACSHNYNVHLSFCFELHGVYQDLHDANSLIKKINKTSYQILRNKGVISDGMIPKLDNAFSAIDRGVKKVCILHYSTIHQLHNPTFDAYTLLS